MLLDTFQAILVLIFNILAEGIQMFCYVDARLNFSEL